MNIQQILNEAKKTFKTSEDFLGVEVLLAKVLNRGREYLITHQDVELSHEQFHQFQDFFDRFLKGEPVAYIIQQKEFYGFDFYVDQRVLIPRPETEFLIDVIKNFLSENNSQTSIKILDVGTGSGCIAITLAKILPNVMVTACDISSDALQVAKMNAKKHDVFDRVSFFESDLLENISGNFDIVVANLPYIGTEKFHFVSKETYEYEPHVALFGGENGLFLYEKLFRQIQGRKMEPALLLGEFGFLQTEALQILIKKYFPSIPLEILQDYANIDRVFVLKNSYARKTAKN